MYPKPSLELEAFLEISRSFNLIPVYFEIAQNERDPLSVFHSLKLSQGFLLESSEQQNIFGRYSFIGGQSKQQITGIDNPFPKIESLLRDIKNFQDPKLPPFHGGLVGYLGYECIQFIEEKLKLGQSDPLSQPLYHLLWTDTCIAFDHQEKKIFLIANAKAQAGSAQESYAHALTQIQQLHDQITQHYQVLPERSLPKTAATPESNMTEAEYRQNVEKAQEYIRAGDIFQLVLSQRFSLKTKLSATTLYQSLRKLNPSPYMFLLQFEKYALIGSSPEILARLENGKATLRPIAGTRPRGKDQKEDQQMEIELKNDPKENAEHLMLVDLARNDLGRVAEPGSVKTHPLAYVERYSHVMHLVSNVTAQLKKNLTAVDLLKASFPAGTVSGAPKIRAMEIISQLEPVQRRHYAGTVCYFDFSGNMDSAITLRTLLLKNGEAIIQAGAGIVYDSDPQKEYEETRQKAAALLRICGES